MFVGRKEELRKINELLKKDHQNIMIYGKRKIGKTTLILESAKHSDRILLYYECIKDSLARNTENFARNVLKNMSLPSYVSFPSFEEIFDYLDGLGNKYLVVIDEYPYLKENDDPGRVDSSFQRIIDKKYRNIDMILSGSHIGMMKQLLEEKNALFSRFSLVIKLEELDYHSCQDFYPDLSAYEKAAFYSVFGGSPFICRQIDETKTLQENICGLILDISGSVFTYLNNLLLSDYSNRMNIEKILSCLSNGKKKYSEIEMAVYHEKTGNLNKQLQPMIDMGILSRNTPINKPGDNKKTRYEIGDNLLRFYYTYLHDRLGALQVLGPLAFYEEYVAPSIITFISRRFESIGIQYFSLCVRKGKIKGVRNIGTYYYDDPVSRTNGEFDIALEKNNGFDIIEVKYLKNKLDLPTAAAEIDQIKTISEIDVDKIGFISINGFEDDVSADYLIDGNELYAAF